MSAVGEFLRHFQFVVRCVYIFRLDQFCACSLIGLSVIHIYVLVLV